MELKAASIAASAAQDSVDWVVWLVYLGAVCVAAAFGGKGGPAFVT